MHQLIIRQVSTQERRFSVERMRSDGAKSAEPVEISDPADLAVEDSDAKLATELTWYLENYLDYPFGPNAIRAERAIAALDRWGRDSFERLFGEGLSRDFYHDATRDGHASLQLVIASDDAGVLAWPWEALHDPLVGDLAHHCRIERHLTQIDDPPPLHESLSRDRIRILLVTARPYEGDVAFRSISRPLVTLIHERRLPAEVKLLRPPTLARLRDELEESPGAYHIVHFDGHGGYGSGRPSNDRFKGPQGHLVFEKDDGSEHPVGGDQLSQLLREHRIPVVVLNACQSATIGLNSDDPFASVATSLLKAGVRSVLAMGYSLYVSAANQFLPAFYERLFQSGSVAEATRAGRQAMLAEPERRPGFELRDWIVPVLYQQQPLGLDFLRKPAQIERGSSVEIPESAEFNAAETPYGLIGRDSAILALERASRRRPGGLLLHGLGGVGKTTLARGYIDWLAKTAGLAARPVWISFHDIRFADYVLNRMLEEVIGPEALVLPDSDKWRLLREALLETPRIIVWDNFESASGAADRGQDEPMSSGDRQRLKMWLEQLHGGRSKIVITSRSDEAWLGPTACFRVPLGGLAGEERQELARAILADQGVRLDPRDRDTANLIENLEGHPLMMRAILPRLANEQASGLIAALDRYVPDADSSNDVERKLYATLRYVEEGFPEALRPLLVPVGFHVGYVDSYFLGSMAEFAGQELTSRDADQAMALLEVAGLAQATGGNLFRLHPALTRYLQAREPHMTSAEDVAKWQRGFVDVMAHIAESVVNKPFHEQRSAHEIFGGCFHRALQFAEADGWPIEDFGALSQSLAAFAHSRRNFPIAQRYFERLLERVEKLGMVEKAGALYHRLGNIALAQRDFRAAEQRYHQALDNMEAQNNLSGTAATLHSLGVLAQERGNIDTAIERYQASLAIKEKLGDEADIATTLHQLGNAARQRGDLDDAEKWYKQTLELKERVGDPISLASTHHQMGIVAFVRKDFAAAERWFMLAAKTFEAGGYDHDAAKSFHQIGMAAMNRGDWRSAEEWLLRSVNINERLGDEAEASGTYAVLGISRALQRDFTVAEGWVGKSLAIAERLDLPTLEATRSLLRQVRQDAANEEN